MRRWMLGAFLLAAVSAYFAAMPLFKDLRDSHVGKGLPQAWGDFAGGTVTACRGGSVAPFMQCLEAEESRGAPRMSFLLVHDIFEHSGGLEPLVKGLWGACAADGAVCNIYAPDLSGHGETRGREGRSGAFTMDKWVSQVADLAEFVRGRTSDSAVFVVGVGIGGEVAFQAMQASKKITGAVCNGLLLPSEVAMVRHGGGFFRGWMGEVLEVLLHGANIYTPALISPDRMYDKVECDGGIEDSSTDCHATHDAGLLAQRMLDPNCQWHHPLSSLRTILTYKPEAPASSNTKPVLPPEPQSPKAIDRYSSEPRVRQHTKPVLRDYGPDPIERLGLPMICVRVEVLVIAGAHDLLLPPSHILGCFGRIGGPRALRMDQTGGHQVVRGKAREASELIFRWSVAVLDGMVTSVAEHAHGLAL